MLWRRRSRNKDQKSPLTGASALATRSWRERVLEAGAVASGALPILGGPVSQVLNDFTSQLRWERAAAYLEGMETRLKDTNSASREYVTRAEFVDLLRGVLRRVLDEASEARREMLANLLETAVRGVSPTAEAERVLRALDRLDEIHVRALRLFQLAQAEPGPKGVLRNLLRLKGGLHDDELGPALGLSPSEARAIAATLEGQGLVLTPSVRLITPAWRITEWGQRLLAYLIRPQDG